MIQRIRLALLATLFVASATHATEPIDFGSRRELFVNSFPVTRPLRFSGEVLQINYATSAVGGVRVEIQDAHIPALKRLIKKAYKSPTLD